MPAQHRHLLYIAATSVLAACVTTVQGGAPAGAPRVEDVKVVGNRDVPADDITEGLAMRGPEGLIRKTYVRLDRLAMEQDLARIESYYHRRGFYSAKVVGTRVQEAPDGVVVFFKVDEGKPTRVVEIDIDGLPDELMRRKSLSSHEDEIRVGGVFRYDRYEEFKDWFRAWLAHKGYPHAIVDGEVAVDRDVKTAAVRIKVDIGPKARFGKTDIKGLRSVPESAVRNRIAFHEGEPFDPAQLELTQGRLYQLGLLSAVRVDYEKEGRPEVTDIHITVTEAKPHELRLGGGAAIEGGFDPDSIRVEIRGRTDYILRGVPDSLSTLRFDFRPAWQFLIAEHRNGPAGEANVTLDRADLFAPRLAGQVMVGYQQHELDIYAARGPVARLGLQRPFINERLILGAGWRFKQMDFFEVSPAIDAATAKNIGLVEPYRLGFFEESIAYDWRDHPLDPRRGFYAEVTSANGGRSTGGTDEVNRATGDLRGYVPLGRRVVIAARTLYGRSLSGNLPITERFYDGGANGHRGFSFRQLSPIVSNEEGDVAEIGGDERFLGQGELRVDVATFKSYPVGVVGFADAGDVVKDVGDLRLGNLHWAGGLGLRYDPIIALRLDVGYRLNRFGPGEPSEGNRFAFHFSIGQAF
ncbi:MAG TPA: BamA/TamA family outer membrane protein [Kofleriaceae bacterium]|nr:BamA/TamA family outer membrane protein [Kofleriaceae bacterium]